VALRAQHGGNFTPDIRVAGDELIVGCCIEYRSGNLEDNAAVPGARLPDIAFTHP
jgi:hypothetical protein